MRYGVPPSGCRQGRYRLPVGNRASEVAIEVAKAAGTGLTGRRRRERMGRMWKRCFCPGGSVWLAAFVAWAAEAENWFPFDPKPDAFTNGSATDLRFLNERFAGEQGFIGVKDGQFIHSRTGEPVRFWAVNGPPHELTGADLRQCARMLAKHGVNLVRVHGGYFDERGEVDPAKVKHAIEIVEAMKAEG